MQKDLLQEAREERRKSREQVELVKPLREGFERLLVTCGTLDYKPTLLKGLILPPLFWLRRTLRVGKDKEGLYRSLISLKSLKTTLGEGRDQVQVEVWDWLNSQIVVRVEGLPERLMLEAELGKSKVQERRMVEEWKERWVPVRSPNPQDVARYRGLLEALEKKLGSR